MAGNERRIDVQRHPKAVAELLAPMLKKTLFVAINRVAGGRSRQREIDRIIGRASSGLREVSRDGS
jgi:hypothetical protein